MNLKKKYILMTGIVRLPLMVGHRALIETSQGTFHTSSVVAISRVDEACAVFETCNSNYCVSSLPVPDLMAAQPMAATAACA